MVGGQWSVIRGKAEKRSLAQSRKGKKRKEVICYSLLVNGEGTEDGGQESGVRNRRRSGVRGLESEDRGKGGTVVSLRPIGAYAPVGGR